MFADVILPLPLTGCFTYAVPAEIWEKIGIGFRVIVPFGKRKFYTAIVKKLHNNEPANFTVKEIHSLLDSHPIVNEHQLNLWEWISFYYLSPPGDVYKAAIPSKLKLESETVVTLSSEAAAKAETSETEKKILALLKFTRKQKIDSIEKQLKIKNILPHIYSMVFKDWVKVEEDIAQKFLPKTEMFIRLNNNAENAETVIGRAKKQVELYSVLRQLFGERETEALSRKEIVAITKCTSSVLNGLIEKGVLIQYSEDVSRADKPMEPIREPFSLNQHQQKALEEIKQSFEKKNVCLLHGVTSSGKTEIYIHLIGEQLKQGKQTLFLVPEIALTTQLTLRLQAVFGDKLGIYHSKINDNMRAEIWHKMLSDSPYEIILGVRSSLFLPFRQLGLVIVDEEHETSYKQHEPAPRYHARDTAIMLAHQFGAKTLLGSATPSMESYFNATTNNKYCLVLLTQRFEEMQMPEIRLENTRELRRKRKMKSLLSPSLIEQMHTALQNGEQIILFRNRRGFAPMLECKLCAWTPKCHRCDISLTYHKFRNELKCHYCNAIYKPIDECPVCHEKSVEMLGEGTETLQEEVSRLFPKAVVSRMDTDTTRGIGAYEKIITDFQERRIQILVGTQMLSKGLDFDNVSTVGVISADSLLNHPDFRSHELGFQLMMQSAGRAGRKNRRGTVVIQTSDPEQPIYHYLQTNNFEGFYNAQLAERKLFHYPPYNRLIAIILKHRDECTAESGAQFFACMLKSSLGEMVLGPNKPIVSRIQRLYIRQILLKPEPNISPQKIREFIRSVESRFREEEKFRYVVLYYDVDVTG